MSAKRPWASTLEKACAQLQLMATADPSIGVELCVRRDGRVELRSIRSDGVTVWSVRATVLGDGEPLLGDALFAMGIS